MSLPIVKSPETTWVPSVLPRWENRSRMDSCAGARVVPVNSAAANKRPMLCFIAAPGRHCTAFVRNPRFPQRDTARAQCQLTKPGVGTTLRRLFAFSLG
jgi:hypothetical protein